MVAPAVPKISSQVIKSRCEESTTGHMISYCGGCREAMERGGVDSLHILDLIFGERYMKNMKKAVYFHRLNSGIKDFKLRDC